MQMTTTMDDVRRKFREYWPTANMPDCVRDLWRQRLSNLNPGCLYECLDDVRLKYTSSTPQLKWVLNAYHSLYRSKFRSLDMTELNKAHDRMKVSEEDSDATRFKEKVSRELALCSENELRDAAKSLPISVSSNPSTWGDITKGLVWLKLFGNSLSSASPDLSLDHERLV